MGRAGFFDRLGELLELRGEGLELADEEPAFAFGDGFGRFHQRVEHHGDARQDRFLNPFERLFEARLLVPTWHEAGLDDLG